VNTVENEFNADHRHSKRIQNYLNAFLLKSLWSMS